MKQTAADKPAPRVWTLTKQEATGPFNKYRKERETVYTYESGGEALSFCSHPTKPFAYAIVRGNPKTGVCIVNAFVAAGMSQHELDGFNNAISLLIA